MILDGVLDINDDGFFYKEEELSPNKSCVEMYNVKAFSLIAGIYYISFLIPNAKSPAAILILLMITTSLYSLALMSTASLDILSPSSSSR